jgi:Uma2 family endonuclease
MAEGNKRGAKMSTQILTYEDYRALPEMMRRYEIINGELIMPPAPLLGHQWRSDEICFPMKAYVTKRKLGLVVSAPVDVMISRNPLRTRQPDILYICFEQLERYGLDNLEEIPYFDIGPDLVVEIISPSESRRAVEDKLADYQRVGVQECWLVHSATGTIEIRGLSNSSQTVERFSHGERVESHVLPGWHPLVDDLLVPMTVMKQEG